MLSVTYSFVTTTE